MENQNASRIATTSATENPFVLAAMNSKQEVTLIEVKEGEHTGANDQTDRKYIIPLALKTPTPTPHRSLQFKDSSTNIDDLKRHILMLQNLTKNDDTFQSKFVVFPNLRSSTIATAQKTATTIAPTTTKTARIQTTTRLIPKRRPSLNVAKEPSSIAGSFETEKITIIPQVFLQNDQTPMNDDSFERGSSSVSNPHHRKDDSNNHGTSTRVLASTLHDTVLRPSFLFTTIKPNENRRLHKQKLPLSRDEYNNVKKHTSEKTRRLDAKMIRQQMRRACKQHGSNRQQKNCTIAAIERKSKKTKTAIRRVGGNDKQSKSRSDIREMTSNNSNNSNINKRKNVKNNNNMSGRNKTGNAQINKKNNETKMEIKSRTGRSHRRNMESLTYMNLIGGHLLNNQSDNGQEYEDLIDTNPELCYKVTGLTYGQQKLCVQNTKIMPAVSRGARAAIQVRV